MRIDMSEIELRLSFILDNHNVLNTRSLRRDIMKIIKEICDDYDEWINEYY